jgi:hypothetical protein
MLTYDEFVEKLTYEPCEASGGYHTQVAYGMVDNRCMFVHRIRFPRFGEMVAHALTGGQVGRMDDKETWQMQYCNPVDGECNIECEIDVGDAVRLNPLDGTVEDFERKCGEKIEGLDGTVCHYYTTILHFVEEEPTIKCAYEMYRRRRQFNIEHD